MLLLVSITAFGFVDSSSLCQSPSLLQTSTREWGSANKEPGSPVDLFNLTSWNKLFPTWSLLDLDELSGSAVEVALDTCPKMPDSFCDGDAKGAKFNKSAVWKMINPSVYAATDGSLRTLAVATAYNLCQCADNPNKMCLPDYSKFRSALLVSCGANDGCTAVGPGIDPHAFQFEGHPMAFTALGWNGVCSPKLLNLTSFEQINLTLPGMTNCEKNWQPFRHNGTLFFSQWLHPEHRVVSCSAGNGSCEAAFNTSTPFDVATKIHGSTPYVELDSNHFVAAAHTFDRINPTTDIYRHMFFAIERQPPFAVIANTEWFQLPIKEGHADAEWNSVEYAGGLVRRGQDVIISYSAGDCISQAAKISIAELKQALAL